MWEAFAAFGLGTNAVSGGANSTSPTNGFNIPANCQGGGNQPPNANAGPDQNVTVNTLVTLNGSGSNDPDSGPSPLSFSWAQISGPAVTLSSPNTATPTFTPTTTGTHVFRLTVSDGAANDTDDVTVNVTGGGGGATAVFDPTLQAPRCGSVGNSCDSGPSLVLGRDGRGPEPNQPNTINDSCADGTSGVFHADESNDRIVVSTTDGTNFAPGKTVRIDATVWAWTTPSADRLDLYFAANANSPTWTFIATLTPTVAGSQTLSATYTLPSGALQAVRAQFRYQGAASPCTAGGFNDRDDLVFAVTGTPVVTVFSDDFETNKGWTTNPNGTDTATTGQWERGDPEPTDSARPQAARHDGERRERPRDRPPGRSLRRRRRHRRGPHLHPVATDHPAERRQQPDLQLLPRPRHQLLGRRLPARQDRGHHHEHRVPGARGDGERRRRVGQTTVSLNAFAGQTVRIVIEAADAAGASLVEAAIDDVSVTQP